MHRIRYILSLLLLYNVSFSRNVFEKIFPRSAFTAQYAGSTGFLTFGVSKVTPRNKLEIGFLYGFVPKKLGGLNQSLNVKLTYTPFQFKVGKRIAAEPLQTGMFLSQNFNKYSALSWSDSYPKGYYWWTRSLRFHVFASTQVSFLLNKRHVERVSLYLEANTNDLYVFSYLPNRAALDISDILFLGSGIKLYIK